METGAEIDINGRRCATRDCVFPTVSNEGGWRALCRDQTAEIDVARECAVPVLKVAERLEAHATFGRSH
jgi:hypothetical protein